MTGKSLLYKWTKIMQKVSRCKTCVITKICWLKRCAKSLKVSTCYTVIQSQVWFVWLIIDQFCVIVCMPLYVIGSSSCGVSF